jgi:hypothetical protein
LAISGSRGKEGENPAAARAPSPQELAAYHRSTVSRLPPGECELLYGRAGYLCSLLWLERQLGPGAVSGDVIKASAPAAA